MTKPNETEPTWLAGPLVSEFPNNSTKVVKHGPADIVVIHWNGAFSAFRNECLHQEMPIHAGYLAPDGFLLCPFHNWCYQVTTGECLTVPGAALEQFPVQIQEERVWIGVK